MGEEADGTDDTAPGAIACIAVGAGFEGGSTPVCDTDDTEDEAEGAECEKWEGPVFYDGGLGGEGIGVIMVSGEWEGDSEKVVEAGKVLKGGGDAVGVAGVLNTP